MFNLSRRLSLSVSAAIVSASICLPAHASVGGRQYGNDFLATCENAQYARQPVIDGACIGFIEGARYMLEAFSAEASCIPYGVTNGQVFDLLIQRLKSDPKIRHLPTVVILANTISRTYPCQTE